MLVSLGVEEHLGASAGLEARSDKSHIGRAGKKMASSFPSPAVR